MLIARVAVVQWTTLAQQGATTEPAGENLTRLRVLAIRLAYKTKRPHHSMWSFYFRAIDGARTRGLDLGKVARYQLRHYRICCRFNDKSYSI